MNTIDVNNFKEMWASANKLDVRVGILAESPPPSISFLADDFGGNPLMHLGGNGDIYVKGELIENNIEVVEGMKMLLDVRGITFLRDQNEMLRKKVEELQEYKDMYNQLNK